MLTKIIKIHEILKIEFNTPEKSSMQYVAYQYPNIFHTHQSVCQYENLE